MLAFALFAAGSAALFTYALFIKPESKDDNE